MEADFCLMAPMKNWKLSLTTQCCWGYCSAVTRKRIHRALTVRLRGKIDLADYLHCDRSFIVGGSNFLKFFHDTSTLESSQRPDHSRVESVSILGRRIGLPVPSPDPDF
jgi:hypothetical protein